jgi:hypothetical protein
MINQPDIHSAARDLDGGRSIVRKTCCCVAEVEQRGCHERAGCIGEIATLGNAQIRRSAMRAQCNVVRAAKSKRNEKPRLSNSRGFEFCSSNLSCGSKRYWRP